MDQSRKTCYMALFLTFIYVTNKQPFTIPLSIRLRKLLQFSNSKNTSAKKKRLIGTIIRNITSNLMINIYF